MSAPLIERSRRRLPSILARSRVLMMSLAMSVTSVAAALSTQDRPPPAPAPSSVPPVSTSPVAPPGDPPASAPSPTLVPTPGNGPKDGSAPDTGTAELDRLLAERPTELQGLGLSLRPPKQAIVEVLPDTRSYRIDDGHEPPRFIVRVQPMVASAGSSSPEEQFEQHQRFLIENGQEFTILRNVDLEFGGARAKLAYLAMEAGEGVTAITGWLLIQTGPNTFVVFSIITSGVDFPEAESLLAASFSTISLKGLETTAATQATKLDRTQTFLASLTRQKLRAIADDRSRWFRIFRPGAGRDGSDLEIGFLRIRAFEGERGDVSTSSVTSSQTQPENGLMVEVIAKLLVNGDAAHLVDVQSRYWQSWDRLSESWSTVSTERGGKHTTTWGQTGWRSRPMSTNEQGSILTVVNSQPTRAVNNEELLRSRQPSEWEVPEVGYINQAEMVMLGSLLPRDGTVDGDFAFYCYDSRTNKVSQRIDRWSRDPDGSGRFTLLSQPSADGAEMKQLFGVSGERLRRIDADGLLTELIEHADLLRIWKTKGLPTG